jgi:hypothetical protein
MSSYDDKDFWQRHYWDEEQQEDYQRKQDEDIERKYPGWRERWVIAPMLKRYS